MSVAPSLTSLPPEILTDILASSPSPRVLFNFILTSKACNQVFLETRTNILTAVLRSSFGAHFPEAVAACRARGIREQDLALWNHRAVSDIKALEHRRFLTRLARNFLEDHFASRNITDKDLREPGLLTSLGKLWFLVDYFVGECRGFASWNLLETLSSDKFTDAERHRQLKTVCLEPLSADEYSRFQRSLVHFELYRRVFASSYKNRISVPPGKQAQIFLKYLWPWEREQLSCIYEFLSMFVVETYNSMSRDFVGFMEESHDDDLRPRSIFHVEAPWGDWKRPFNILTRNGKTNVETDKDRFPSLGLPCLRAFMNADDSHRHLFWQAFGSAMHFPSSHAAYFEEVLNARAENYLGTVPIRNCAELRGDAFKEPPRGWVWARGSSGEEDVGRPENAALCLMGYVLWDAQRFERLGFVKMAGNNMAGSHADLNLDSAIDEKVSGFKVSKSAVKNRYSALFAQTKPDPFYEQGWEKWFATEY